MDSDGIDHTIVSWRAWYIGDGGLKEYTSEDCDWSELPEVGVLVVLLYYRTRGYTREMTSKSWYWREETSHGTIYACDDWADAIFPRENPGHPDVKRGRWTTDQLMVDARRLATDARSIAPNEAERVDSG